MNSLSQAFTRVTSAVLISSAASAWWYRPIPMVKANQGNASENSVQNITRFRSSVNISDVGECWIPYQLLIARFFNSLVIVTASQIFLKFLGDFRIISDVNYEHFLESVCHRKKGVPLITVANHRSVLDDPTLIANILPYWKMIQPRYLRWSICTQNMCFSRGDAITAFFGAGKTLPIVRGDGINQKLLLDFARHVAGGEWVNIFPEGGCWQRDTLGGRENGHENEIGKLKWGVGKLIAHSPIRPIVIPIIHMGMETVMPQDPITRAVLAVIPKPKHKVVVRFGEALHFNDLIEDHEKQYGKLWTYEASEYNEDTTTTTSITSTQTSSYLMSANSNHSIREGVKWLSSEQDKILYHKIVVRIEAALLKLNEQILKDKKNMSS